MTVLLFFGETISSSVLVAWPLAIRRSKGDLLYLFEGLFCSVW